VLSEVAEPLLTPAEFPSVLGDMHQEVCAVLGVEPALQGRAMVPVLAGDGTLDPDHHRGRRLRVGHQHRAEPGQEYVGGAGRTVGRDLR
jgi:hypothetical protein